MTAHVRTNEHGQPIGEPVPDWAPRLWPASVTLQGRYVRLEPITTAHAEALYDELCGPEDASLWTYRAGEMPPDLETMTHEVAALASASDTLTFAVVPAGEERAAGMTTYMRIDPRHGSIEVAAVIYARRLQRTPATTEATHLLALHAFEDLGYRRFEWKCDSLNEPSRLAATRLGFAYEGRFRQAMVYKGRNRDTDWFSMTDTEWPTIKAAHECWLDPANFDPSGHQLTPLTTPISTPIPDEPGELPVRTGSSDASTRH